MTTIVITETMGEGQGEGRAVGARDTTCLEPLGMFLFLFSYFLSTTELLFTFRTTAMTTNGPATTSTHRNDGNGSSNCPTNAGCPWEMCC